MIRLVFLIRRQEHLSLDEFQSYWLNEHAPLVAEHGRELNILRYTQSHRIDQGEQKPGPRGVMEVPYDGVAELWFANEAAFRAGSTDAGKALLADERTFIDLPNSPIWLAYEYPQVNPIPENLVARPKSGIVKLHFPLRHPDTMSLDDAQLYWRTQHGPLIRSWAPAMGMLRYQQVHRFESPLEAGLRKVRGTVTPSYTGHAEAWFDRSITRSGAEAAAASRAAYEDETNFIDFARSAIWTGKEHVIIDQW